MSVDTEIHRRELLITLDYLINYTNEKHPATQIAICEYARDKYNLKFDKKNEKGNEIKRQRISECLNFLYSVSNKYIDDFPFVIEETGNEDRKKYYIDKKNFMDEELLIKLLSFLKNDKNISNEDEKYYFECLLNAFSPKINHEKVLSEVEKNDKKIFKNSQSLEAKLKTINRAIKNEESIKIRNVVYDTKGEKIKRIEYLYLYRVYALKEINHRPFVILVPVSSDVDVTLYYDVRCDFVDNLDIVKDTIDDEKYDGRINDLFKKNVPWLYDHFGSIDKYVESAIIPVSAGYCKVVFYFNIKLLDVINAQFENMFNQKLNIKTCSKFEVVGRKVKITDTNNPTYAIAYTRVNVDAFISFLLSDPYNTGKRNVSDMVKIISPSIVNDRLEEHYKWHYEKYKKLNEENKK